MCVLGKVSGMQIEFMARGYSDFNDVNYGFTSPSDVRPGSVGQDTTVYREANGAAVVRAVCQKKLN